MGFKKGPDKGKKGHRQSSVVFTVFIGIIPGRIGEGKLSPVFFFKNPSVYDPDVQIRRCSAGETGVEPFFFYDIYNGLVNVIVPRNEGVLKTNFPVGVLV